MMVRIRLDEKATGGERIISCGLLGKARQGGE